MEDEPAKERQRARRKWKHHRSYIACHTQSELSFQLPLATHYTCAAGVFAVWMLLDASGVEPLGGNRRHLRLRDPQSPRTIFSQPRRHQAQSRGAIPLAARSGRYTRSRVATKKRVCMVSLIPLFKGISPFLKG